MIFGGCQVVIRCGGTIMQEYDPVPSEDGDEISCWIASKPGKEFRIEYSRDPDYGPSDTYLTAELYFGSDYSGRWVAANKTGRRLRKKKVTGEIKGSERGGKLYSFMFANPEIIEGETPSSVDPDLVGDIGVELRFTVGAEAESTRTKNKVIVGPSLTRVNVNEKDKVQGAHCVVLKGLPKRSRETAFTCTDLGDEDTLSFVFRCRSEEWLRAEGIMRKRPRQGGRPKPAEDSEGSPLPKPGPVKELAPADGVPAGGAETMPITGSLPRPLSATPLSYADDESVARHGERAGPTLRPTLTPLDFITLEPPHKIARRSGNSTFTINDETRSTTTEACPVRQSPAEGGSGSNVQVEGGGSVSDVGVESGPVPKAVPKIKEEAREVKEEAREVKEEVGEVKEEVGEVKFSEMKELKEEEKELEEQMAELRKKKEAIREKMATFRVPKAESETGSPRPKLKTERESTRLPFTLEVIDLTDA